MVNVEARAVPPRKECGNGDQTRRAHFHGCCRMGCLLISWLFLLPIRRHYPQKVPAGRHLHWVSSSDRHSFRGRMPTLTRRDEVADELRAIADAKDKQTDGRGRTGRVREGHTGRDWRREEREIRGPPYQRPQHHARRNASRTKPGGAIPERPREAARRRIGSLESLNYTRPFPSFPSNYPCDIYYAPRSDVFVLFPLLLEALFASQ